MQKRGLDISYGLEDRTTKCRYEATRSARWRDCFEIEMVKLPLEEICTRLYPLCEAQLVMFIVSVIDKHRAWIRILLTQMDPDEVRP